MCSNISRNFLRQFAQFLATVTPFSYNDRNFILFNFYSLDLLWWFDQVLSNEFLLYFSPFFQVLVFYSLITHPLDHFFSFFLSNARSFNILLNFLDGHITAFDFRIGIQFILWLYTFKNLINGVITFGCSWFNRISSSTLGCLLLSIPFLTFWVVRFVLFIMLGSLLSDAFLTFLFLFFSFLVCTDSLSGNDC